MQISYHFFPEIVSDNDEMYFSHLEGIISSVDEYAELEVSKFPDSLNFRLIASLPRYNNLLIQELIKFHNIFKIRLDISKSIKTTSVIAFKILI